MDVLAVKLGDLIATIGRDVADAQETIDRRTIEQFAAVYDQSVAAFEPLRAIGYQPTWYQITEAAAQVSIALRVSRSQGAPGSAAPRRQALAAPVDAGYRSRFGYSRQAASALKFRIVPVPAPAAAVPPAMPLP